MRPFPWRLVALATPSLLAKVLGDLLSACRTRRGGARSPPATCARRSGSRASSRGSRSRQRRLHGRARGRRRLQHAQRELERGGLRGRVVRPAGGIAEREVGEQQPRHADVLDDVLGAAHHDGGDAGCLQRARGEADALMADRAVGDRIAASTPSALQRATISGQSTSSVTRWLRLVGSAVEARRERADAARAPRRGAARAAGNRCRSPRPSCACGRCRRARCAGRDPWPCRPSRPCRTWPPHCRARPGPGRPCRAGRAPPS